MSDTPDTWDKWKQEKGFKTTRERIAELQEERQELEFDYRIAMRDTREAEEKESEIYSKLKQNKKELEELGEDADFDW